MGAVVQFIVIALVTLPLAGVPFAICLYLDYRKYLRTTARPHLHIHHGRLSP
jgi:hypothetical protein